MIVTDLDGRVTLWNRQAEQLYGWSAEQALGRNVNTLVVPAGDIPDAEAIMARLAAGETWQGDFRVKRRDGSTFLAHVADAPIRDARGELAAIVGMSFDVSSQAAALDEAELHAQRTLRLQRVTAALATALTPAEVATALVDAGTKALGAQGGWVGLVADGELVLEAATGYPPESLEPSARLPLTTRIPGTDCIADGRARWFGSADELASEYPHVVAAHRATGHEAAAVVPLAAAGPPLGCVVVHFTEPRGFSGDERALLETIARQCAQALERARLFDRERRLAETLERELTATVAEREAEARAAADERRRLLDHLVHAQEEERRRIAADVHDDYLQALSAVGMQLERAARAVQDPDEGDRLLRLRAEVDGTAARMRHLVFRLRPPVLDWSGLESALRTELEATRSAWGIEYRLQSRLASEPEPSPRLVLFRIAQEAIVNARRHAQADTITVALAEHDGGFAVTVEDDGVGMPADRAGVSTGHIGLATMRERAEAAGGWWRAEARPRGTRVEFWVPATPAGLDASPPPPPPHDRTRRASRTRSEGAP